MFEKTKINEKEAGVGPFFLKKTNVPKKAGGAGPRAIYFFQMAMSLVETVTA